MQSFHWNNAQSRVQSLKNDLANRTTDHLQSFLDGISDPEPPDYHKVNGKTEPPLAKVTLKANANTFQVGNVIAEDGTILCVCLAVDKGEVEVVETDALPKDHMNPLATAVPRVVLVDLFPLWIEKVKAIKRRMTQMNDIRSFAHNAQNLPDQRLSYGKNLEKLMAEQSARSGSIAAVNGLQRRKRASGEPVLRHPSNKRRRIGLESVPDSVKIEALKSLPDQFVVDLFSAVFKTAMPNFENLVMAAWNVISIYEFVGTEFSGFHTAILELRSVLEDFDATYRKERSVARNEQRTSQSQNLFKMESPANYCSPDSTVHEAPTTSPRSGAYEERGSTMASSQVDSAASLDPPPQTNQTESVINNDDQDLEIVYERKRISVARSQAEAKSSDHLSLTHLPRPSPSSPHCQPNLTDQSSEMMDADERKYTMIEGIKKARRRLTGLQGLHSPHRPTHEQGGGSHAGSTMTKDRNGRPFEDDYREGGNGKPIPIGPKPSKHVHSAREMAREHDRNSNTLGGQETRTSN